MDQDAVTAGDAQGADDQVDGFIAAPAQQKMGRVDAVVVGQGPGQGLRLRFGIAVELLGVERLRPRGLVGVEPDGAAAVLLACREVAAESAQIRTDQFQHVHAAACRRMRTAAAWASRPSQAARVSAQLPIANRPLRLTRCVLIASWKLATLTPL